MLLRKRLWLFSSAKEGSGMSFSDVLLPDDVRGYTVFKRDPLAAKVVAGEWGDWIFAAEERGEQAARWVRTRYGDISPYTLAAEEQVQVIEQRSAVQGISPYSDYQVGKKVITVYSNVLEELTKTLARSLEATPETVEMKDKLKNVVVAHEMFHYLEDTQFGWTHDIRRVVSWRLGPFTKTTGIRAMSEIAAHSFVRAYLGPIESYLGMESEST